MRIRRTIRTLLVLVMALAVPALGLATEVPREVAQQVAEKFMQNYVATYGNWGGVTNPFITEVQEIKYEGNQLAYNMKVSPSGHLLIPYHDEFSPVLLYSTTSQFIPERVSEKSSIESWIIPEISETHKSISRRVAASGRPGYATTKVAKAWGWLKANRGLAPAASATAAGTPTSVAATATGQVGPLLSTSWAQNAPFNLYTPGGCSTGNMPTGCVATAMAQLMKYWSWPDSGVGSKSYQWGSTTLSADFNHPYFWSDMPNLLTSSSSSTQQADVARLMSDAGISVNMNYGCSGSSAYINSISTALVNNFKYQSGMQLINRGTTNDTDWFNLFKAELDASQPRPVLLSVFDVNGNGGHELVVDGYQIGATNMVHVNLGWGGNYDGWYDVTHDWTTSNYTWSGTNQYALTNIQPNNGTVATYSVSGTVRSGSTTGPALAGATVAIGGKTATTDAGGAFSITGLASGSYTLTISLTGYTTSTQTVNVSANQSGLTFVLTKPAATYSLSGTVRSGTTTGPTLAGATVAIGGTSATTNSSGAFSIAGLASGSYTLTISLAGYTTLTQTVNVSTNQSGLTYVLNPAATYSLSGTVRSGSTTGPTLAGATVTIGGKSATTNSSGAFSVTGLASGSYTLTISLAGYNTLTKTVTVSSNQSGLTYVLTKPVGSYTLSGTVRSGSTTGPTLAGATVTIGPKTITTDAGGAFSITGLAAGTYAVTVSLTGYSTVTGTFTVGASQSGIVYVLQKVTCSITGKVYGGSTSTPLAGAVLSVGGTTATTDATGTASVTGIGQGSYPLSIAHTGYAPYTSTYNCTTSTKSTYTVTLAPSP